MGISTSIIVESPITTKDAAAVFTFCRDTIGGTRQHRWHEGPSKVMRGASEYTMTQNQGLPVWLRVFYTTNGVLPTLNVEEPTPEHTLEVWLLGGTDHTTHERFRKSIGDWLSQQRFAWQWSDDYGERIWRRGR